MIQMESVIYIVKNVDISLIKVYLTGRMVVNIIFGGLATTKKSVKTWSA